MRPSVKRKREKTIKATAINAFVWVFLIIAAMYILAPLVFMFTASVMPAGDIMKMPYRWIPKGFHWQNYWQGIRGNDGSYIYLRNIFNSLVVASIVTMTTVFLSALTGYGLAKFHFRGRYAVFMMILATMMIPFEAMIIPSFIIIVKLGWLNTYLPLIIPMAASAFGIFFLRQYIKTIPDELMDAARIDGCSYFGIYYRVLLPTIKPAMVTLAIFIFKIAWNQFLWPLIVIRNENLMTMPQLVTLFSVGGRAESQLGVKLASATMLALPIVIAYVFFQRYFIQSMATTGLKE